MNALDCGYNGELDRIQDSFAIVRYCLSENVLSDRRLRQFFKEQASTRVAEVRQATIQTPGEKQFKEKAYRCYESFLRRQRGPGERALYRAERIPDWLGRSELLLLISAFEYWLKDFYGLLVTAEPRRAFSRSKETVTLAAVFGGDACSALTKTQFFRDQLEAAVARFDHTRIKDRLKQLVHRYELNLEEADIVRVDELVELRINISHRLFHPEAVTVVSPKDLDDARKLFRRIPADLLKQARKRYPHSGLFDS